MSDGQEKPVAHFEEIAKGVVLNKTKARFLAQVSKSKKFDDWIGLSVDIAGGVTQLRGEDVLCIKFEKTTKQKKADVKDALNDDLPDDMNGSADKSDGDDGPY
jgi:hypothetical protein